MRRFVFLLALTSLRLAAHPDIDAALAQCDALIAADPSNAGLYLDRGELHAQHNDLLAANADYQRAARLSPRLPRLDLARGALALAKGQPEAARVFLNRALELSPSDAEAMIFRGRAHAALGDRAAALADYNAGLALIASPSPDLYLARAVLYAAPADAIRSLDEGIERLGPAPSLVVRALVLEESTGKIDAALTRLARVLADAERPESWLKVRGDLLARAGREREARAAYADARSAIATLPDWLRASPDSLQLAAELARLLGDSAGAAGPAKPGAAPEM